MCMYHRETLVLLGQMVHSEDQGSSETRDDGLRFMHDVDAPLVLVACQGHVNRTKGRTGMGWDGTGNRVRPLGWDKLRRKVWREADGRCIECGTKAGLTGPMSGRCDHIVPWAKGGSDERGNLQWLCQPCHAWKCRGEAKELRDLGKPHHPGLR